MGVFVVDKNGLYWDCGGYCICGRCVGNCCIGSCYIGSCCIGSCGTGIGRVVGGGVVIGGKVVIKGGAKFCTFCCKFWIFCQSGWSYPQCWQKSIDYGNFIGHCFLPFILSSIFPIQNFKLSAMWNDWAKSCWFAMLLEGNYHDYWVGNNHDTCFFPWNCIWDSITKHCTESSESWKLKD